MKRRILSILAIVSFGTAINAQIVNIPDANFKAALVADLSINTNGDPEIQVSEAIAYTGALYYSTVFIADLTGIEAFTSLTVLDVDNNQLTVIDVSSNTSLTTLLCRNNQLTTLDVSSCLNLNQLACSGNQLTMLNAVNGNNSNFLLFNSTNNPNLICIQVDDALWSTTNWTNIDVASTFSENCSGAGIDEPINHMVNIYPNPTSTHITIDTEEMIEGVLIFDLFGSLVQSENSVLFSVENLSKGVYMTSIKTKSGIIRSRFIKE